MKRVAFAVPFVLALLLCGAVRADDTEMTVDVGCQKCTFKDATSATECGAAAKTADGKILLLTGDAVKDLKFKDGGTYILKGKISEDGKSVAVTEIKKKE